MPTPTPSQIIAGKYELRRELARGGMGSVWEARDLGLGRDVALKLILAEGGDEAQLRERFAREARVLASLSSRHIVHVFDFGFDGESPYLVMELLHGEDLGARLKQRQRLSLAEADALAQQLARGLAAAHERELVHRDLKPANIFLARLDGEEVAKVLDFGIAKLRGAAPVEGELTRTGAVVGTPQYMSPEQLRASRELDLRSDLWALGAVLYRCVTGQPAFGGASFAEVVLAITSGPTPAPTRACPELPAALDAFFARAFQREPAARFQSARELGEAFSAAARGAPLPAPAAGAGQDGATVYAKAPRPAAPAGPEPRSLGPASLPGPEPRSREATPLTLPERPSIAVMPFQNLSGDPAQDYFADGMAEELITALARLRWLFVIARPSTFAYKGRAVDVRQVGRELGVRYVLEGSVRKAGARVRITGQLVEAESGAQLWADRYDGDLADVFDLQDRITASVVGAVEPNVQQAEIQRALRKHPDNLDAYDLVLRAVPHTQGHSREEADRALELLGRALALEPGHALAHGYAAFCLEQRYVRGGFAPADREAALRHARAALDAGSTDATALALGGFVVGMLDRDARGALTALDEAIAQSPNSAAAFGFSSVLRVFYGELERGVEHAERAIRLSPLDPGRGHTWISISYAHFFSGRFAEAEAAARKSAQANPRFPVAQVLLAASRQRLGQAAEARAAVARLLEIEPGATISGHRRIMDLIGVRADWVDSVVQALRQAGLPE